jgi:hypothetical protein
MELSVTILFAVVQLVYLILLIKGVFKLPATERRTLTLDEQQIIIKLRIWIILYASISIAYIIMVTMEKFNR